MDSFIRAVVGLVSAFVVLAQTSHAQQLTPFDDWAHGMIQLPTVRLHYRYAGSGPPLLLIHGNPQHSLCWHTVGPILAQEYTVIAPDNRGMGASTIPTDYDYTAETTADDYSALMDFLNITQTYVFSHDKGSGLAAAFVAKNRDLVKRVGFSEYGLPGFGYEELWAPNPTWDLYANWQLAFFSVPDASTYFIQGREREMLSWYFWHAAYAGDEAVSRDHLTRYTDQLSKPGFLRSMLMVFSTQVVAADNAFFTSQFAENPLTQATLVVGGEASLAPTAFIEQFWGPIANNISAYVVPRSGHWILDENPEAVAEAIANFLAEDDGIPAVDLSNLQNRYTLLETIASSSAPPAKK